MVRGRQIVYHKWYNHFIARVQYKIIPMHVMVENYVIIKFKHNYGLMKCYHITLPTNNLCCFLYLKILYYYGRIWEKLPARNSTTMMGNKNFLLLMIYVVIIIKLDSILLDNSNHSTISYVNGTKTKPPLMVFVWYTKWNSTP